MGPFSPVKATAFHQQTVSRVTQDREAERHDEDQQVYEAPVRSSFNCSFNNSSRLPLVIYRLLSCSPNIPRGLRRW